MQNSRYSPLFYINFSFADILFYPRMEYDSLLLIVSKAAARMVAETCCAEGIYKTTSIKQTAQTAIMPPMAVLNVIIEMPKKEDPEICLNNER